MFASANANSATSSVVEGLASKPSDESVWLERISLYEKKMIEAQDNERMMKQELLEANKALKAVRNEC